MSISRSAAIKTSARANQFTVLIIFLAFILASVYIGGYIRYTFITKDNDYRSSYPASGFLSNLGERLSRGFAAFFGNEKKNVAPQEAQYGIVAVPDYGDHDGVVARVRNAFSDEVKVTVDPEGDAGVITPVFRDGDDTENYAFVMVPIKQQ
jgi:hypothetical protein